MELWVHVSRLLMPHLDSDQWKHFILNILLLVGGDATHSFYSHQFYCCMFYHTLDCNYTCQNNPRLGFLCCFWHVWCCMYFHPSMCRWWCRKLFFFSLHITILHMSCLYFIKHLTHPSFIIIFIHHCVDVVGNSSSSPYTPPSACVVSCSLSISLIHIIMEFSSMSRVPSLAQSYQHLSFSGGWAYWITNHHWFTAIRIGLQLCTVIGKW